MKATTMMLKGKRQRSKCFEGVPCIRMTELEHLIDILLPLESGKCYLFNSFIGYVYKLKMNTYTRKETKNG